MKKLLGISVIAMLAVAPAFADPVSTGSTPSNDASATIINTNPPFAEVAANSDTDGNAASAGYVKGAYNAAIKAINKVNAKVNSELATSAGNGIDKSAAGVISVTAKTNGGIAVDSNGVAVDYKSGGGLIIDTTGDDAGKLKIATSGVGTAQLADGAVTTAKIDASAVTTAKIADSNVTTAKIADANVTADKLATDSVTTAKIADGNVTTAKLDAGAVTTAKIADGNVTLGKIAAAAIENATDTTTYSGTTLTSKGYVDEKVASLGIGDYATKTGVDNTINALTATVNDGFALASGAVTGSVTVPIMNDWSNPDTASSVVVNGNNISLSVGTAITEGTVTINKTAYASAQGN